MPAALGPVNANSGSASLPARSVTKPSLAITKRNEYAAAEVGYARAGPRGAGFELQTLAESDRLFGGSVL